MNVSNVPPMTEYEKKYYDLLKEVAECRRLQREFYQTRNSFVLKKAKAQEKKVDAMIVVEVEKTRKAQQSLNF